MTLPSPPSWAAPSSSQGDLQQCVDDLVGAEAVPGISIAVYRDGVITTAAAGILNSNTSIEVTTDSIFQIGSITKTVTASLVMRLVEEGRIALDAFVRQYLPSFHVADEIASQVITIRQLLAHTSGIAGDFFPQQRDIEDDSIERYVDRCYWLPQAHSPGSAFSYCNAGYVILGRVIESVCGLRWSEAVRKFAFEPVGLSQSITHPSELTRFRAAIGHFRHSSADKWQPVAQGHFGLATAPAGATIYMTAQDLARWGAAHLEPNQSERSSWLSPETRRAMREVQAELHENAPRGVSHWGLGWFLFGAAGGDSNQWAFGHDGSTPGQQSVLRIMPEENLAVAICINSQSYGALEGAIEMLSGGRFKQQSMGLPSPTHIPGFETWSALCGTYGSIEFERTVAIERENLVLRSVRRGDANIEQLVLRPINPTAFAALDASAKFVTNVVFLDPTNEGQFETLHMNFRRHNRRAKVDGTCADFYQGGEK